MQKNIEKSTIDIRVQHPFVHKETLTRLITVNVFSLFRIFTIDALKYAMTGATVQPKAIPADCNADSTTRSAMVANWLFAPCHFHEERHVENGYFDLIFRGFTYQHIL